MYRLRPLIRSNPRIRCHCSSQSLVGTDATKATSHRTQACTGTSRHCLARRLHRTAWHHAVELRRFSINGRHRCARMEIDHAPMALRAPGCKEGPQWAARNSVAGSNPVSISSYICCGNGLTAKTDRQFRVRQPLKAFDDGHFRNVSENRCLQNGVVMVKKVDE